MRIRILTWNIHKQEDDGWEQDLTRFAAASDIVLLQEVALADPLQAILRGAGLRFVMGSSFAYNDAEFGVLTATRVAPVAACTQRIEEPLIRIPKSAVITWLPLPGTRHTLAVANVHSINFSLSLDAYEAQLAALADVLAQHEGPILLGGDLNTWSQARRDAVERTARRLDLVEIPFAEDGRTLFLGNQVDHLLVRGLVVATSRTTAVTSSDHNPAGAVLRLAPVRALTRAGSTERPGKRALPREPRPSHHEPQRVRDEREDRDARRPDRDEPDHARRPAPRARIRCFVGHQ